MIASALPWVAAGGATVMWLRARGRERAYERMLLDTRGSDIELDRPATPSANVHASPDTLAGNWVWPVVRWNGRDPVVSSGFGPRGTGDGSHVHAGADIMYRRTPRDTALAPGTPGGSKGHVMPTNVLAVAAGEGSVWSARKTERGWSVVIDHGPVPLATLYLHLEQVFVTPTDTNASKQRVVAGQPLGIVGYDPLDSAKLRHLHFAVWSPGPKNPVDPVPYLRRWAMIDDPRKALLSGASAGLPKGRNAAKKRSREDDDSTPCERGELVEVVSHSRSCPFTAVRPWPKPRKD